MGRKSAFKKEFIEIAYQMCKEYNASCLEIAKKLKVSKATIVLWRKNIPEFKKSIEKGKIDFWNF